MIKYFLKSLPAVFFSIIAVVGITYAAGSLTAPSGTVANTMYTLTDIYNMAKFRTAVSIGSGYIPTAPGSVSATLYSLTEVYNAVADMFIARALKTGQITCFDPSGSTGNTVSCAGTGQDGEYELGVVPSFTEDGGITTDNNSGLMWISDPSQLPGGIWGTPGTAQAMTFAEGLTNCEALSFGGYDDWRLPNIRELQTIVDFGQTYPSIDASYFPNTELGFYWSSTTYGDAGVPGYAWLVVFEDGSTGVDGKAVDNYVRCVR